jgi:NAD(P)-dependent dehydrogenase (short-subunit alcohol dehydrogenase family)
MLFSGKNIIVTGASGDLGTAITQRLITRGAHVLAVDSNAAGLSTDCWDAIGLGGFAIEGRNALWHPSSPST